MSPTFVLVPGAWQGGWAWQPVARRLREAGYAAVTVTPETDLGAAGVAAYAARQGAAIPAFLDRLGPALTPEQVGTAIVDIAAGAADDRDAYLLTATGLSPVQ